jgi:hypothetical protein
MIFFNVNIKKITFIKSVFNKTKIKTKINNFLKEGAHPAHPSNFSKNKQGCAPCAPLWFLAKSLGGSL